MKIRFISCPCAAAWGLLLSMLLAAVGQAANPQLWQITFTYGDAGLVLHKAVPIPSLAKRVQTPGLEDAPLQLRYDIEWLDAAGQPLLVTPAVLPLGCRAGLEPAAGAIHEEMIPAEGAVVVRVEGPADGTKVSGFRLVKRSTARSLLVPPTSALTAPSAFGASEQTFKLSSGTSKAAFVPGPVAGTKVRNTGSDSNRLVIVFLGDGFTEANLAAGSLSNKVAGFLNYLLGVKPWNFYSSLVNAYRVDLISNQSGADYADAAPGSGGTLRDTYLNSAFWQGGTERLLTLTGNGSSRAYDAADAFVGVGVWDKIMVFVNSTKYGGSGGSIAVSSLNSTADQIQVHEFGHSYPGLADEYDYGSSSTNCSSTSAVNVDCANNFPHVKWDLWVTPGTPIPTPDVSSNAAVVGAFEGAHYQAKGMFRPKRDCYMRSLGVAFCPVCVQAHIVSLLRQVRIVDVADPPLGRAEVPSYGARTFSVTPLAIGGLQYQWYLNGALLPSAPTSTVPIASSALTGSNDLLRLEVTHSSTNVRSQVMSQTNLWNLSTAAQPTLAISDSALIEGSNGFLRFALTLSFPHDQTVTVAFATANGSALAGTDYFSTNGVLSFAPGQTTNSISVRVVNDSIPEGQEYFFVNLSGISNAIPARSQAAGQIVDDDRAPLVSITSPSNGVVFFTPNLTVSATASDYAGTITNLAIYLDGALVNEIVASSFSLALSNLADGWHELTAQARNSFGLATFSSPVNIRVFAPAAPQVSLLSITNTWRFDATTNDYGSAWKETAYDDSLWSGPSNALFYSETATLPAPKNTPLVLTNNGARLRSYYFRTSFSAPSNLSGDYFLISSNLIDDGAVYWLNGVEAVRLRMTNAIVTRTDLASAAPPNGGDATAFELLYLPASRLQPGSNVLAVEVHQQADSSSDVVFGMSLALVSGVRPVFLDAALPADASALAGASVTLSASATGNPIPSWQWFRGVSAIPGATNLTLVLTNFSSSNAGAYFAIASNMLGAATSRVATVSVLADTFPPTLVAVLGRANLTSILVSFSEPLDPASAATPGNYRLATFDNATSLAVLGAVVQTPASVLLTTAARVPGTNYALTVNNVRDLAGNVMATNSQVAVTAETIVLAGDNQLWRYFQSNAAPALGWAAPGFNDSAWPTGPALFDAKRPAGRTVVGPSNAPVRTVLSLTNPPTATSETLAYYFRAPFTLSGSPLGTRLSLRPFADDGAVFYLNGQEVYRLRMAAAPASISYASLASATQDDTNNVYEGPFEIPSSALVPGTNWLTVEVHQSSATSSDLSFAAELTAQYTAVLRAPVCVLTAPMNGAVFNTNRVVLSATVTNNGNAISRVEFLNGAGVIGIASNAPYNFTWTGVTTGSYALTARAVFAGGLAESEPVNVTFDFTPPAVALVSPTVSSVNIPNSVGLVLAAVATTMRPASLQTEWAQVSGPGTVTFGDPAATNTTALFSAPGAYVLRFSATDAPLQSSTNLTVNVGAVPNRWTAIGIGTTPATVGYTQSVTGVFTLGGGGVGVQSTGTADDFFFLHQAARGDVDIRARVVSVTDVAGSSSRAGVMIREAVTRDAREAFMGVTAANGSRWIWRASPAATSANIAATVTQPYWVRLVRSNNVFTAYTAPNSGNAPGAWTSQGSQTIPMSNDVRIGLAAASGSSIVTNAAVIDNLTITPAQYNGNLAPFVTAGTNAATTTTNFALKGFASDDGAPIPPALLTTVWNQVSGPATATFANPALTNSSATFPVTGAYALRLTAGDGQVKTFADVLVTRIELLPPQIVGFTATGTSGTFQFGVNNTSATNCTPFTSTNLVNWAELVGALRYSNGVFTITDPSPQTNAHRFYRLRWP